MSRATPADDRYAALLLWRTAADVAPRVRLVSLGEAATVERAVQAWRSQVQKGLAAGAAGRELRERLWGPLAAALPPGTTGLVVAPDGELALLPFEALRLEDGKYLVERYAVRYTVAVPEPPYRC